MRLGACTTVQNTLTQEAASVLKHSLNLARRRGHAQVTPLHVAATLLSLRASLLKRACLKSSSSSHQQQQNNVVNSSSYPLQCRALELCFNVALNRLPTTPAPLLHGQPSLSNALIAALKRAQAHQRRGCIEQQQQSQSQPQQPLLAIKVELEQLVISILDDPSVSRVMREAGFSSTNVKSNIEEEFSSSSSSSASTTSHVFQCYGTASGGGVFSSPCSPQREMIFSVPAATNFWQTQYSNLFHYSSLSPPGYPNTDMGSIKEDVKLVLEVILGQKRKNVVVVGDCASATEGLICELMGRVERGDVPIELKQTQFIKFQFAPVALKLMRREDVEINLMELRRKLDSAKESGGAIIYTGDLGWAAAAADHHRRHREGGGSGGHGDHIVADHLVEGIGRLVADYCGGSSSRVWLVATSSYQSYMRCQMRQPPLEVQWALQAVSVPSGGLGLSLQASSNQQDPIVATPKNPSQVLLESKPFITTGFTLEGQDKLFTCCPECTSNYENEARPFISGQKKHSPSWLQPLGTNTDQKDELAELKRKWNNLCLSQNHQARHNYLGQDHILSTLYNTNNNNQSLIGKSFSQASSHQWWPTQSSIFTLPNSISFNEPAARSGVPKFRRQSSCTIDFSFRNGSQKHQAAEPTTRLDSLRMYTGGKEENISLSLGSSFVSGSGKSEKGTSGGFCRLLRENVPWQSPAVVSSIADALSTEPKPATSDAWLLIDGNDMIGKRRLALAIAAAVSGSPDSLLRLNMARKDPNSTERLAKALRNKDGVVVLIEEVGLADTKFLKFLADRFEEGKFEETSTQRENHQQELVGEAIFILTKGDHSTSYQDGVIQMMLQLAPAIGHKRRAETELPSNKIKAPKLSKNPSPKRDLSRQSSCCNSLDLNTMAVDNEEEAPGEFSPNSSDLTRETCSDPPPAPCSFLDAIHNRYVFNRKEGQGGEVSESLWCKFKRGFEEVLLRENNVGGFSFSIEERVIEEVVDGGIGSFLNSQFDEWLKEVFQTSLRTIGHRGGEGGGIEVKLCFGGKSDRILEDGFWGTYLPNKIKVSFMD